ncbi:hypothetical protein LMG29739_00255 [Paraburkholderia solisilvae]|uniref:Ligase-CoA domain-containing protein n=1 Tax=Paraburkholderia solisilvae TaxID=624376 RepID=A0A6J5D0G9_9BURK|nr:hypothetical protein [Paraburkholderia solisilvae]CAB3746724.1 hypothetical protein LMG29739_00255 [Paraburkholderia solisilvae]
MAYEDSLSLQDRGGAHRVPAYAYSTQVPVAVRGAKYKWARGAGKI